jgi:hypothetical protein
MTTNDAAGPVVHCTGYSSKFTAVVLAPQISTATRSPGDGR